MPRNSSVVIARFVGGPYHGQQMPIKAGCTGITVPVHTQGPPKFVTYRPRSIAFGTEEVWVLEDIETSVAVDLLIDLAFNRPKKEG